MSARLEMLEVSKHFGATQALQNVSLIIQPGEIHALIGENGAGKSTLMKILSGAYLPDSGQIKLDGKLFTPKNPRHARDGGIAMIYQELSLAPHLTVEENILLGDEPRRFGWIQSGPLRKRACAALAELDHASLDPQRRVADCSLAEKQIIEIARALLSESRVVIMDEPTSSLTRQDTLKLFGVIRQLKEKGVSVIYISHFLEECQELCDQYTVLRDGKTVQTGKMEGATMENLVRAMVGREVKDIYPKVPHEMGPECLRLQEVSGNKKPRRVTLSLRKGEILGVAGLIGAGRTEMLRAAFGLDELAQGSVLVCGQTSESPSPSQSWGRGVGFVSENRKEEGLMLERSIADNLTLSRMKPFQKNGMLSASRQTTATAHWMEELRVKAANPAQTIGELSGGNQQKVALGRLLHHEATILLLDEPTRGIDVGSKMEIYRHLGEWAAQGKSIIFVSSYLPELMGVCDTIAVMSRGRLVEIRPAVNWTEDEIMSKAISNTET